MMSELLRLSHLSSRFCVGMEGNVSMKTEKGFFIKASGVRLSSANQDDFIEYDSDGIQRNNFEKKASMELGFHKFFLQQDDVNFVCHTHPINVLKILCGSFAETFSTHRIFPDQVIFNGEKSCLVQYQKPGDNLAVSIEKEYTEFLSENSNPPKVILLKNHGLITYGKTVDECIIKTEICEKSAEIFLGCLPHIPNYLTKLQTLELLEDKKEEYRYNLTKK